MTVRKSESRVVGRVHTFDCGDFDEVQLLCMGDIHVGDPGFDPCMVADWVKWLNADENRFAVIAGDLFNAALKDSVSSVYSEAMTVKQSREALVALLEPAAKKIVGAVSGNHDRRVNRAIGDDVADWAMAQLMIPYFGPEAFLHLRVGCHASKRYEGSPRVPIGYKTYLCHGVGGGRLTGGVANNMKRLAEIVTADLYIQGHSHRPLVVPDVVWSMNCSGHASTIIEEQRMFVSTGASLDRGASLKAGYAAAFAYPALPKLWPIVTLSGRAKMMTATI